MPAGLLLLALPAGAQLRFGEVSANANGTISSGYTATYGNMAASTHSWTVGGAGTFSGSFHNPNFLSFTVSPYLNQSRANSDFQSISDASGVNATANIFAGSPFPGSVSYSLAYNSEGNYAVPGLANYVTHGDSNTFGINWSQNLPDAPSFSAGFQMGSSSYSVYGTNDQGNNAFHSVNLHSAYKWAGFNLGAYYMDGGSHSLIPEVVAGQTTETHSESDAYGFNVMHLLPMQGSISANINRSDWNSDYLGYKTNGTIDTVNAIAGVHPTNSLSLTATANYSDNLAGQLIQAIVTAGGVIPGVNSNATSNSFDLMGVATYTPMTNLQTSAFAERRSQTYEGQTYGLNSYGGSATYARGLLDGTFNASLSLTANNSDQNGEDTLGFSTTENYSTQVRGWHLTGSFGYAQNVQTLLVTYMNSFYNFSGNVRRNWGRFNISAGAAGGRTALTQQAGTLSSSETYNGSVGYGVWFSANGGYSRSSGQALITGGGLVPIPLPPPILPSNIVSLYGGDSYSVGVSSTPVKRLILAGSYARSTNNTSTGSVTSANQNSQYNALVQYQYRKLYFTSGYARLEQGFSVTGTKPEILSSYYMGVSRWFNFF